MTAPATESLIRDILIVAILVIEVGVLTTLDRSRLGSWVTPFSVLAVPYVMTVATALVFAAPLGFYRLYVPSLLVWVIGLAAYWLVGLAVSLPFAGTVRRRNEERAPFRFEYASENIAIVVSAIIIPVVGLRLFFLIARSGLAFVATDEFARAYGTGITAHMMVLCYPLIVLLIGTLERRKVWQILVLLALFVLIFAYQVKAWVVVPVISGLLYRWLSGRLRLSVRGLLLFGSAMLVFFFASYLFGFGAANADMLSDPNTYLFLIRHFFNYLWAGVLAFGQLVKLQVHYDLPPGAVFAPLANLYRVVAGLPLITQGNPNFIQIEEAARASNVYTLFGTLLLYLGSIGALLYVVALAAAMNLLYVATIMLRNCWLAVWWVMLGAMLAMGWFDLYFWLLTPLEVSAYSFLLSMIVWAAHAATPRQHFAQPHTQQSDKPAIA